MGTVYTCVKIACKLMDNILISIQDIPALLELIGEN